MKLSMHSGRWTDRRATLAAAGILAVGCAVGSAIAMSPTVAPPIKWQGGAEFATALLTGGPHIMYTVPAGRSFILTDLVAVNETGVVQTYTLSTGTGGTCSTVKVRLPSIAVPPRDTGYLSLQTGIGVAAGQAVCLTTSGFMNFAGRGFLFTPAPPG